MHDNDQIVHRDHDNRDDLVWKPFVAIFGSVVIVIIGLVGLFAPLFLPEIGLMAIRLSFLFALPLVTLIVWVPLRVVTLVRQLRKSEKPGMRMSWDILITGLAGWVFTLFFWIQWRV